MSETARILPPKQRRSRDAMARIVAAAQALLLERAPDNVRVVDIVRAAGVTIGGFYSRFPDKEALLDHLEERLRGEMDRHIEDMCETASILSPDPAALLGALLRGLAGLYERNAGIARRMVERAQGDPELRSRLVEINQRNMQRVIEALAGVGAVDHHRPELALEFALLAQRSLLREAILFPDAWGARRVVEREVLIEEIRRMMLRYLGLEVRAEPRSEP